MFWPWHVWKKTWWEVTQGKWSVCGELLGKKTWDSSNARLDFYRKGWRSYKSNMDLSIYVLCQCIYIYIFICIRSCRTMILIDFQQVFVVAWLKHLGFECSWIEQGWGFTNGLTQCWPNVGPDWWCWLTKTPVTILQSIINHRLGLFSRWFGLFSQWEIHHDWGIYSEYFYFLGTP